jgi:hypothetical protein
LTGYAFIDSNLNNQLDPGESGLGGVNVSLYASDGTTLLGQATTDVNGAYHFDDSDNVTSGNLQPGNYVLVETPPIGYVSQGIQLASPLNPATAGATPDTINVTAVTSDGVTAPGSLNFGLVPAASISGKVYFDSNGNGVNDAGDTPISGEFLLLSGTDSANQSISLTASTGLDGSYSFTGLRPGTYSITNAETTGLLLGANQVGMVLTGAGPAVASGTLVGADTIGSVTLGAGSVGSSYLFSEIATEVTGQVVIDAQGMGFVPGQAPQAGVTISLYNDVNHNGVLSSADGAPIATTTTAADGTYKFVNFPAGAYIVKETVPSGYVRTTPVFQDYNDVSLCNCGIVHGGVNFANFPKTPNAATNIKYTDVHSGKSTTVTDLRGKTHQGDQVSVTFTVKPVQTQEFHLVSYTAPQSSFNASNADEQVVFQSQGGVFTPGTYTLSVTLPNGFYQVDFFSGSIITQFGPSGSNIFYTPQGRLISADNAGSRVDGVSSLSGFVYFDANQDHVKNSGDTGIGGVTVVLEGTDYLGNIYDITTTTAADGSYSFTGLDASSASGYTLIIDPTQAALAPYTWEADDDGSLGGTLGVDQISAIFLNFNQSGANYDFAEIKSG